MNETLDPAAFTMEAVLERVASEGDLFAGVLTTKQSLSAALKLAPLSLSRGGVGLPRPESSAMSRRKKSDVVQSTTTRSLREKSGSWKRW